MKKNYLFVTVAINLFLLTGCNLPGFSSHENDKYKIDKIESGDMAQVKELKSTKLLGVVAPPNNEAEDLTALAKQCANDDVDLLREMGELSKEEFEKRVNSVDYEINPFTYSQSNKPDQIFIKVYKSHDYDAETINYDMVKEGYALPTYCILASNEYKEKLHKAVDYAKDNNKGLWKEYHDVMSCLEEKYEKKQY